MLIHWLETMDDRDALHEALLERLRELQSLRRHHAAVERELARLRAAGEGGAVSEVRKWQAVPAKKADGTRRGVSRLSAEYMTGLGWRPVRVNPRTGRRSDRGLLVFRFTGPEWHEAVRAARRCRARGGSGDPLFVVRSRPLGEDES